ncbi:right-handed parallel beta-helix repeat-containing protein [Methylomonas sp. EFPC1]|uniref:right-handed parallel beta-helix repeat-containing protein n=1 Tax=Methylomonas sp. EFPC1 TaxID=2812647 RepID=UPI0019685CCC|nr:right-handed parallel beta-helix repeat-containing protein [Methylomonas sp. EFPC1]QSB01059.1 right-handed parallel beta-helix repeat-containing protein [Methylomonas sp. EFPC1]
MLYKFIITLTIVTCCSAAAAQDFYVSPTGSDKLNGLSPSVNFWTKTGPFKTITRAQQAIRKLKADGKFNQTITVHVGQGIYRLQAPLEFNDSDSGLPGQEIIWEGVKNETFLSGAMLLDNCEPFDITNPLGILSCSVDNHTIEQIKTASNPRIAGEAPQFELFVDDVKMHLARWPNNSWLYIRNAVTTKTEFKVFQKLPKLSGDLSKAQVHIFPGNDFFDQYIGISMIDTANNQITLSSKTHPKLTGARRFYLQNFASALDAPEEWFYDANLGKIYFIPPKGKTGQEISISRAKGLLSIDSASHIEFKNFAIQHVTADTIKVSNSENILLDTLKVSDAGGKAIIVTDSKNITISNSELYNSGQGGIFISGGDRPKLESSHNHVYNNHIHDYDTILYNYSPALELAGVGTTINNNLISSGFGVALLITGNDHLIEKNEITNICQQSGDCGAIYSGRDWTYRGNIIRYNNIHDLDGYTLNGNTLDIENSVIQYTRDGARGIYLDDAASGYTVFGNILNNPGSMGVHIGGGRDNLIENNIILSDRLGIFVDYRGSFFDWNIPRDSLKSMPITSSLWQNKYPKIGATMHVDTWPEGNIFRRNVIISSKPDGRALRYWMPKETNIVSDNVVWHTAADFKVDYTLLDVPVRINGGTWTNWVNRGMDTNSLNADPCLSISRNSIKINCADSPLYQVGFQPIPSDIGLIAN